MTNEPTDRKRNQKPDWEQLIPEIGSYLTPGPAAPEDWAFGNSNITIALGFAELFWPPFHEYDGMVFRGIGETPVAPESAANVEAWLNRLDRTEVERMLNHEHLIDLFWERQRDGTRQQIRYLAEVLQETWAAKLAFDFPTKDFNVELFASDADEIDDWFITFSQRSKA